MSQHPFYRYWSALKDRVKFSSKKYRDVKVCHRWQNFGNFKEDMFEAWLLLSQKIGGDFVTLLRKDASGDFEKENCFWADKRVAKPPKVFKK